MAPGKDFEKRYFDKLDENFRDIKDDIKAVGESLKGIEKRLVRVEKKVFPAQTETVQQLPSIWRDPQFIKLLTYAVLAVLVLLIIFAALKGVQLPKGLFQ